FLVSASPIIHRKGGPSDAKKRSPEGEAARTTAWVMFSAAGEPSASPIIRSEPSGDSAMERSLSGKTCRQLLSASSQVPSLMSLQRATSGSSALAGANGERMEKKSSDESIEAIELLRGRFESSIPVDRSTTCNE